MNPYTRTKIEERAAQTEMLRSMQTRASDEKRDLTDDERKTFDEIVKRIEFLDAELARLKSFDEGAAKFAEIVGASALAKENADRAHESADEKPADTPDPAALANRAAFGKRFIESTAFKGYRGAGTSERVTLPGPASVEFRAAITLGDMGVPAVAWGGAGGPTWDNTFLNTVGHIQTNGPAVTYLTWAPEPPADAAAVDEGALKPEANMTVTDSTVALKTYAHWKAITRQALEDVPQIQSIVQNRLLAGVRSKLEAEAVAALVAAGLAPVAGDDLLTAIRSAMAEVETAGYGVNAIVVNPADAAAIDLSAMAASSVGAVRAGSAWGAPIVSSNAVAAGTAYVGDFSQGVTWWDRGTTDVFMSDSHADFFLRNQLVILAEARAAFAVTEPGAIAAASVTP